MGSLLGVLLLLLLCGVFALLNGETADTVQTMDEKNLLERLWGKQ